MTAAASLPPAFVRDTLALWRVDGSVDAGPGWNSLTVRGPGGALARIEPAPCDIFRWYVHWQTHTAETPRLRPCGSLVGVLTALRRAFGVEQGAAIRIGAQAEGGETSPAVLAPDAGAARGQPGSDAAAIGGVGDRACARLPDGRVPVTLLTGFLGSGKTTLLARLLRQPAMGRTAVIVNELGEIGLDHDLIETSDESFVQLTTGCLCCRVRSDLVLTLGELATRRRAGQAAFERVVIETSGLADPAPILHALMTDPGTAETYALAGVVTTVDAITGLATLDRHPESLRQAAVADTIVLTKTDLSPADVPALTARLVRINAAASILPVVRGEVTPQLLFAEPAHPMPAWVPVTDHAHTAGIAAFGVVRDRPLHAAALALFLSALADNCGEALLRVKGLVEVAETPGQPAVIHGVQHVYHAPQWLPRWPSADTRTRMTFIGRDVPRQWPAALLDLLQAEVDAQAARARAHASAAAASASPPGPAA